MSTIDPKWVINLKGKDYPQWPGILDAATKTGLKELSTKLIQAPTEANGHLAIVAAVAVFEDGRTFCDLGDAGPQNCSPQIASAAVRMASTRAKGRALRDALNIGQTMWEELPDEERSGAREAAAVQPGVDRAVRGGRVPARAAGGSNGAPDRPPAAAAPGATFCEWLGCGVELTKNQVAYSQHHVHGSFCREHVLAVLDQRQGVAK